MSECIRFIYPLDLHLFEGGGEGSGAGAGTAAADAGADSAGAQQQGTQTESVTVTTSNTKEARAAEFDRLLADYRDLYEERTQKLIKARVKDTKALEEKAKALDPVLSLLADKYGVDATDATAIAKAIEEDDAYYEAEAAEKGLTTQQLKEFKKLERENAAFKQAQQERERDATTQRVLAQWQQQAEACKKMYPAFDLNAEVTHPESGERFMSLLRSGVDVQAAYQVIHMDDILGGAMQYSAQQAQQNVINNIRARGMRPPENIGSGNTATTQTTIDPAKMTKKERDALALRAMRGERVAF